MSLGAFPLKPNGQGMVGLPSRPPVNQTVELPSRPFVDRVLSRRHLLIRPERTHRHGLFGKRGWVAMRFLEVRLHVFLFPSYIHRLVRSAVNFFVTIQSGRAHVSPCFNWFETRLAVNSAGTPSSTCSGLMLKMASGRSD